MKPICAQIKTTLSVILLLAFSCSAAAASSTPQPILSGLARVNVQKFVITGNTVIPSEELQSIVASYEGREISAEELHEARYKLTQYYVEQGYINSGAVIPDQEVKDGQIEIRIIEGKLTDIQVQGDPHLRKSYISGRVYGSEGEVLNTKKLQERLQILQQNALVQRFNAELGPGLEPGQAVLDLSITEERPWELALLVNNHRSPSVGSTRAELRATHNNLTGWGDRLFGRIGLTEGLEDYSLSYTLPINRHDTRLVFYAEKSDSEVISSTFSALNITSNAETYSIGIQHPFYKAYTEDYRYRSFEMGLSFDVRKSTTYLLGQPFSFSAGIQNGESKLSVLRFSQNYLERSRTRVIALSSNINVGLDLLNATINDGLDDSGNATTEPDGRFVSWLGQFRWIERFPNTWNSQLWFRADAQYTADPLLPLEKFALGGFATVRGYRENMLTRDKALVLSLEWQIPVAQWRIPGLSEESEGTFLIAPFADFGIGSNNGLASSGPRHISSVGLGLLWRPSRYIEMDLYWAKALVTPLPETDHDLQDDGIHFALTLRY